MPNSRVSNLYPFVNNSVDNMEMLSVGTGAVATFQTTYNQRTRYIVLDVQDNDVYVTYTGETPSATLGHILYAGRSYTWNVETAQAAKFLSVGGTAIIAATEFTD
ncbi:hypothetical protein LFDSGCCC_CDS0039 [Phage C75C1]|jgi:hypothetical protein|nr:hypothetical protein LFDSGCCC_CDS0039 [Phage C75C1]